MVARFCFKARHQHRIGDKAIDAVLFCENLRRALLRLRLQRAEGGIDSRIDPP